MTTPKNDDKSTLVDPRIAAAWRASSNDEPPASLDAAILAAARREVAAGPEPIDTREARADRRRWWPLAAAATIAAVVVGVLQLTPTDKLGAPAMDTAVTSDVPRAVERRAPEDTSSSALSAKVEQHARGRDAAVRTEPASKEAQRTPASSVTLPAAQYPVAPAPSAQRPSAPAAPSAASPASTLAAPTEPKQQRVAASAPASSPDPFPAAQKPAADAAAAASGQLASSPPSPPPPSRSEVAANAARERDSLARSDAPPAGVAATAQSRMAERASAAPAPPSAPLAKMAAGSTAYGDADEARAKARTPLPVPEWIALIRRLRAEGKQTEAGKELAAFRATHADHEKLLPPDLRDWRPPEK
jgi:hypothetical protein